MTPKCKIEIFSAGCPVCDETIQLVNNVAHGSCEISVLNMNDSQVFKKAKKLGIHRVPAVVINGMLAECCAVSAPDKEMIRYTIEECLKTPDSET